MSLRPRPVALPRRGHSRRATLAVAAVLLALVRPVAAADPNSAAATDLGRRLTAALAHPGFRGATVGAFVADADSGAVLFDRRGDALLVPASNLKLLTALAALSQFGPAHQFLTRVYAERPPDAAGAVDVLAVRGGGDPALTSEQWWRLAADLRQRGVRRVRNGLLLDDTYFDRQRWHPSWPGVSARAFHAPVAALSANYASFAVTVLPSSAGGAARIAVDPPVPYFDIVDRLQPKGTALTVQRTADGTRERVIVSGAPPVGGDGDPVFRSVADPVRYAAAVFRMQLAAAGITVEGPDRIGPVPPGWIEILAFKGRPLADVVQVMMKYSNNHIAEMLVKNMAAAEPGVVGSWPAGIEVMRARLRALHVPAELQLVDGSGLAPSNRVSPRALVAALRAGRDAFGFGPEFVASLPIAGRDGTLKRRARGAIDGVRAKTGLLSGAAGLSGFARASDGRTLAFSVLANGYTRGAPEVMDALDGFAVALVE